MALRGKGIAWLPLSLLRIDLLEGRLRSVAAPSWREPIDIVLVRNRASGSNVLEAFWSLALALDEGELGLSEPP